jgi:hypothetical protein
VFILLEAHNMTQLELDALMNAENLDEIIQEEPQKDLDENDMVHQLSSVTVDSEKKATEIMAQLDQVLVELDAIGTCIDDNEGEKSKSNSGRYQKYYL